MNLHLKGNKPSPIINLHADTNKEEIGNWKLEMVRYNIMMEMVYYDELVEMEMVIL